MDATRTVRDAEGAAEPTSDPWGRLVARLLLVGRVGWALVGVAAAVAVVGWLLGRVSLVVVPVVLAVFPATLLVPLVNVLRRVGLPDALAASLTLIAGVSMVGLVIGAMVPMVVDEFPRLAETAVAGVAELQRFLENDPLGLQLGGVAGLLEQAAEQAGDLGGIAGPALDAATAALEIVAGTLLLMVVLFFFLKDGDRFSHRLLAVAPAHLRPRIRTIGRRAWSGLGSFFRGQLLIALIDAIAIGIGLAVLGVPLALPLAVLIFFGGLFPIVGAVTAGALAVLVALAHGGFPLGLAVLVLVVVVQQLEGNVLEPLILSHVVTLHPLVVILAVTAGAVTFGVLGAFLAVPVMVVVGSIVRDLGQGRGWTAWAPVGSRNADASVSVEAGRREVGVASADEVDESRGAAGRAPQEDVVFGCSSVGVTRPGPSEVPVRSGSNVEW